MSHPATLRHHLRDALRKNHDTLDSRLGRLDLCTPEGLADFVAVQEAALSRLAPLLDDADNDPGNRALAALRPLVSDLITRAQADLADAGRAPLETDDVPAALPDTLHPHALAYVIGGSRLGHAVMARARAEAGAPPSAWFSAPAYLDLWKSFSTFALAAPSHGAEAETITAHSRALFDLFARCTDAALDAKDPLYA